MSRKRGAIIVIGDEILNGSTLDTNSHWLCGQIAGRGALVTMVTVVHDNPEAIKDAMLYCMRTNPDIIFTLGGLGPTVDDKTIESVALFLKLPLEFNQTAKKYIQERYRLLEAQGVVDRDVSVLANAAREKMARLPAGATPLFNPVGAAPAVVIDADELSIVCLPGVPAEVCAIVKEQATEVLRRRLGNGYLRTLQL